MVINRDCAISFSTFVFVKKEVVDSRAIHDRLPMSRICVAIAVTESPYLCFFFLLFVCRSFALLTCDIGISASGTSVIINDSSYAAADPAAAFRGECSPKGHPPSAGGNRHPPIRRNDSSAKSSEGDIANEAARRKVTPCRQVLALRTGR